MTFVVWPTEPGSGNTRSKAPSYPPDSSCLHLMVGLLCVRELLQGLANYVKSEPDNITVCRFGLRRVSPLLLFAVCLARCSGPCGIGGEADRRS
ncbi:hypothetical protein FJTKL_02842 [Diaporthe vaccinii]|uniref:Uncharacterized protein n=1 Tax=Diaporthe vaccinii TaxID=105482 RepID=A0ABR4F2S7_9PEZI